MDRNESILKDFLCDKIDKTGGSAQIKYLCQLLPSLSYEVRSTVANNQGELMRFIRKHSEIFQVDANGNVRLQSISLSQDDDNLSMNGFEKSEPRDNLPKQLRNGEGVVIKIHPTFGFISAKTPIKTTIYFSPNSFGDDQITLLTDIDKLHVGAKVCFHANKGSNERSSKYRAYKVWLLDKEKKITIKNDCEPKSRKTRDTGRFDAVVNEGEGKVSKLFPNYGFIIIDDDKNNTVFFYKNQLVKYENVVDLNKVLKVGDLVEFKAVRAAGQKNNPARWSATQVWVKKSAKAKLSLTENTHPGSKSTKQQLLKNETGKIYPHSKGIIIKFGPRSENIADADSSLFYMLGTKVSDVSWEFSDGDNVRFDAVEIKSHPGWKALLVWTGERPDIVLPPELGDFSEYGDDIDDATSIISKVSENSTFSENSNRSYQPPLSRSSGYSSLRVSHEDLHSKIHPSRNSSIETRSYIDMDVEDISDTTSCYSRSSEKSFNSNNRGSSRSSRPPRRRSANFKKFPNQDVRQDTNSYNDGWRKNGNSNSFNEKRQQNGNKSSNTYDERRQQTENRDSNSFNESRPQSINRNSNYERRQRSGTRNSDFERRQHSATRNSDYERRQRSVNRNSDYERRSQSVKRNSDYERRPQSVNKNSDYERKQQSGTRNSNYERRQENPNKGSNSYHEQNQKNLNKESNSYWEGRHDNKSSYLYEDKKQDIKKNSSSIGKHSGFKNHERFKKHAEFLRKYLEDSPEEVVDDNESVTSDASKNDSKECEEFLKKGPNDLPDETADDNNSVVSESSFKEALEIETKVYKNWADTPYPGEDDDLVTDYNLKTEKTVPPKSAKDSVDDTSELNHDEVYNSEDEFSDAVEEREEFLPLNELLSTNDDLLTNSKEATKISNKCSVKIFKKIEGTIKKVLCRHGQITCPLLDNPANFFFQDVYCNEVPVSDRYDDLREVLKVGDVFKFNCIRVVDDNERNFIKCTLLWKGKKPNIVEMTPKQYIATAQLKVSLMEDDYEIEVVSPNTSTNVVPDQPKRTFLVSVENEDSDSDLEAFPSAAKPSSVCNEVQDDTSSEKSESETEIYLDTDALIEGISKIIRLGGLPVNSQIDLNSVSSEILTFIDVSAAKKLQIVSQSSKETQTDVGYQPPEPVFTRNDGTEMTNTASQTIFTGSVKVMVNLNVQEDIFLKRTIGISKVYL